MLEKDSCAEEGIDIEDDPILQDLTSQMKRMSVVSSGYGVKEVEKRQKILVKGNPVFEINRLSTKVKFIIIPKSNFFPLVIIHIHIYSR